MVEPSLQVARGPAALVRWCLWTAVSETPPTGTVDVSMYYL